MNTFNILHVKNLKFSLETFEQVLSKQLPGKYQIVWYTDNDIWDIFVRWTGTKYYDLVR